MANFFDRINPFKKMYQFSDYCNEQEDGVPKVAANQSSEFVDDSQPMLPIFSKYQDPNWNHTVNKTKDEEKPRKKAVPQYDAKEKITPAKLVKLAKIRKAREDGQLKFWPDGKLAAPGVILRSALFGVRVKREKRLSYERTTVASYGGSKIVYSGAQLDQDDFDVLLTLFDLQKRVKLGDPIEIQEAQFLKMLDRTKGGSNFDLVRSTIARLAATCIEIHVGKKEYYGSLIVAGERDRETGILKFWLDPKIISIFDVSVRQDRALRSLLHRDLTKWLYGYLCSHTSDPHIIRVDTLMPITGSTIATEVDFRKKLKGSLDELKKNDAVIEYCLDKKKDEVGKAYWLLTVWKKKKPELTAQAQ